jgi:molybdate transport system regulatory protein
MEMKMTYNLSCRLFTDAKCFGPGVAQLLHAVQQLHSLRAAALSMDMAYSKAWTIIKNSEKALGFSLLDSTTGGKGGGGAALTPEGARLLRAYDTFCSRLHDAADELFQEEFAPFL